MATGGTSSGGGNLHRRAIELRPAHLRALLCLAEARHLTEFLGRVHGPDYLWPGFDFREVPCFFYRGDLESFLLQHPNPPDEFELLRIPLPGLEGVPIYYHQGALSYLPAVGPVEVEGRLAATLPLGVFRADTPPEALVASLVHEAFHAWDLGHGRRRTDFALLSDYPELSPVNNALGNLEARILYDYLARYLPLGAADAGDGDGLSGARETAFRFSLIRRERRGPLEDDIIDYERQLERGEGMARYVQFKALLGALPAGRRKAGAAPAAVAPAYHPSKAFESLAGREAYTRARELLREQIGKLPELNVKANGAAWWRFFHTGMALGLFADALVPDWKERVARGFPLDALIEESVDYDGGTGDERAIEELKELYHFDERLDAERAFGREEKKRKEDLLATLLRGTGTRLTFDVSALIPDETWLESGRFAMVWDPAAVETVTRNVRIHRHGLRFAGFGTELRFGDLPVVEDMKNRLFHVSLPNAGRLEMQGDGQEHDPGRPAEFEDGLAVNLPGVAARARSGFVQNAGGTLYIKITR